MVWCNTHKHSSAGKKWEPNKSVTEIWERRLLRQNYVAESEPDTLLTLFYFQNATMSFSVRSTASTIDI